MVRSAKSCSFWSRLLHPRKTVCSNMSRIWCISPIEDVLDWWVSRLLICSSHRSKPQIIGCICLPSMPIFTRPTRFCLAASAKQHLSFCLWCSQCSRYSRWQSGTVCIVTSLRPYAEPRHWPEYAGIIVNSLRLG